MKLCDFCGFYVGPEDINCRNCSEPIAGRQVFEEIEYTPKTDTRSKPSEEIVYMRPKSKMYTITRKAILIIILQNKQVNL